MVGSIGSSNAPGLATALMKEMTARQDVAVTMVKKGRDLEKAQGEAALKLIDAAASSTRRLSENSHKNKITHIPYRPIFIK